MDRQTHLKKLIADRRSLLKGMGAAAIGISFGGALAGCSEASKTGSGTKIASTGEEPKLNFYNWDTYIGQTTLADFQKETGVKVKMSLFANNDELFAKLRGGNRAMM